MFLLSLIAVLAGTPLRLAEAADDLARSFAEADGGVGLEGVDGGVGDDSDATIKVEKTIAPIAVADHDLLTALAWMAPLATERLPWFTADSPSRLPANSQRRHALLQCFLC